MTNKQEHALKSCPFCGKSARMIQRSIGIRGTGGYDWWHGIQCAGCHAAVGYDDNRYRDKNDAIRAWNTRAESASIRLAVQGLDDIANIKLSHPFDCYKSRHDEINAAEAVNIAQDTLTEIRKLGC